VRLRESLAALQAAIALQTVAVLAELLRRLIAAWAVHRVTSHRQRKNIIYGKHCQEGSTIFFSASLGPEIEAGQSVWCDTRIHGVEKWYRVPPEDSMLRIPRFLEECVCFVCLMDGKNWKYGGTGLIIAYPSDVVDISHLYVITARHLIDDAKRNRLGVSLRLNKKDGGVSFIETTVRDWMFPETSADIAIIQMDFSSADFDQCAFPFEGFATADVLGKYVGMGTEVFALGLFDKHRGQERNLPIFRSGNVASIPREPLHDRKRNKVYSAYLVELRSIGGLSGSPVFAFYQKGSMRPKPVDFSPFIHGIMLLGLIRGHWDEKWQRVDKSLPERESVNVGIAVVTPIQEIVTVLEGKGLTKSRSAKKQKSLAKNDLTLD
jgi:hypothetical protein